VPVVLLGSCLGIRSDKPLSCRPHLPFPLGEYIPAGARRRAENLIPSANGLASSSCFIPLSASARVSLSETVGITDSIALPWWRLGSHGAPIVLP